MYKTFSKSFTLILIAFLITAFGIQSTVLAQDRSLEETLQILSEDAAKKYLAPISSAFGADLNAGWFHRAPAAKKFGFDIEVGFVAMGAMFPDDAKSFKTTGKFTFSEQEAQNLLSGQNLPAPVEAALIDQLTSTPSTVEMSGATIIGADDDFITIGYPSTTYDVEVAPGVTQSFTIPAQNTALPVAGFSDLANAGTLPLFSPQLSIGTVFGTQLTFRYLPAVEVSPDLGEFKYFGFGIQHNPAMWIPIPLPLDLAASFFTQNLEVGTLFKTTTTAFGVNASKQFGFGFLNVTPYAGFMLESADMEVAYNFIVDTPAGQNIQEVKFNLEGENKTRLTLGLSIRLLLFNINADYNIGKYNSVSAGLTFAI